MQQGILATETAFARYLVFTLAEPELVRETLADLAAEVDGETVVVGIGEVLATALGVTVPGLRTLPAQVSHGVTIPSTPGALWCWLRGDDRGELYHLSRHIEGILTPALVLTDAIDAFGYRRNRDLSGYEDGTENPQDDAARDAAILTGAGPGLDGSSFVAVQQWLHDFEHLDLMAPGEMDHVIGRSIEDNEELDEAPPSAHVKRAAQESFDPEAFMVRRSMPWADGMDAGLIFVAFGHSLAAFEAVLQRMVGNEDGITDGLFTFTRPITGAYYWCPPLRGGSLDLRALGL